MKPQRRHKIQKRLPIFLLPIKIIGLPFTFALRTFFIAVSFIFSNIITVGAKIILLKKQSKKINKKKRKTRFSRKLHFPRITFSLKFPTLQFPKLHILQIHLKKTVATKALIIIGVSCFLISTIVVFIYLYAIKDMPRPKDLLTRQPIVSTKIYDRNGILLYTIYKDQNRTLVPLSQVPEHLKQAVVAIEDQDFYIHNGISLRGIARAVRANLEGKSLQGGSTITQQLIKNTLLTPERTVRRKIRELILAVEVETTFSKDTILEMYLNEVPFGGSLYGVEEASRAYFNKPAKDLTLAQSAMLAGLPQSPSLYSPFGSHPEYAFDRQHVVLERMVESKFITREEAEQAKEEHVVFASNKTNIKAPHFVMYVREQLARIFGEEVVSQGGLEVITTLDTSIQEYAEEAIHAELTRLKGLHVTNGAAIVTNPNTGEIYAMVGSKDYFDVKNDGQVNVTIMPRQPGSSIKGLTYATALSHGFTPMTILDDSPITFTILGTKPYSPVNYDGKFHGKVPLRTAFASSYNVPAVKTLSAVGIKTMIEQGRTMGITTWDDEHAKRFGLSLTLGGGEVLMTDMAKLYGTFANAGETVDLHPIFSVKNYKGYTLYSYSCRDAVKPCGGTQTLDPRVAYQISNILSDNAARSPAFGTNSVLYIPKQEVAVKTGTTNSLRDNWTIGYTSNRLVATWVGNNDNTPMSYVASGITGASPIWRTIMDQLLDADMPHHFATTSGLIKVKICATTGTLPCHTCPTIRDEYFVSGTEPKTACKDVSPSPSPSY